MLSEIFFGRQQDTRREPHDIRRFSLPVLPQSAQPSQAQHLHAFPSLMAMSYDASQTSAPDTTQDPRALATSFFDTLLRMQGGGSPKPDTMRRPQQLQDVDFQSHYYHHQLPDPAVQWPTSHTVSSNSIPSQATTISHGLPGTEAPLDRVHAPSSTLDAFASHSFSFGCLPGLPETSQEGQNSYAHYLDDPNHGYTSHVDPALLPPQPHSTQPQPRPDAMQAFDSSIDESCLPVSLQDLSEGSYSPTGSPDSEGMTSHSSEKKKSARRQGVTCDQCRTKHLRCDLDVRRARAARSSSPQTAENALLEMQRSTSTGTAVHLIRCTRCEDKGFVCTKTHAPPSRRYPRPSRSGKRIEQARMLHGASLTDASANKPSVERINASSILIRALTELRGAEVRINDRVMAGSLSIQLLNCFFAVCHMQAPVVDFAHFSKTFNASNGDPRKMSIMSNGGSVDEGLPSMIPEIQGLGPITWTGTKDSKIGTPGTTETLLAVLHAWAAHYTDAPIAFGPDFKDLDAVDVRLQEVDDNGFVQASFDGRETDGSKAGAKRPKRKQGVACDTCRLRRVRCDVTERPDGMGCSRCEDKRIQCTDTYIQAKRAKLQSKGAKAGRIDEFGEGSVPSVDPANSDPNRLSPRAWISTRSDLLIRSYRPGDIEHNLRRGKARKAFCHALLNHALSLVHKHDILKKPSVESIQILSLLAPLMDNVDGVQAHAFADAACDHTEKLGMSTKLVVDETNRHAVEHMLGIMQAHRVFLTAWCRDSVASGLNRRKPFFKEDRAIEVIGQASFRRETTPVTAPRQGEVVLSGEMGLTFVIMTMVQIGALSRFLATHIDAAEGLKPSIPPWQRPAGESMAPIPRSARFSARPSLAELRKLERACGAVWNSLDSLMLFFDRCASKAWSTMNSLQPFRPLGWIASTKLCGSLLYLALFRALGERHRANAAFMATLSHSLGGQSAVSEEDKMVAASLKALFDKSMQRSIVSCRKTARLIGILLPLGILQTGGPILKQIFPVAQFLAKIPSVSDEQWASRMSSRRDSSVETTLVASPSDPSNFIDPQALQQQHFVEQVVAQEAQRNSAQAAQSAEALNNPSTAAHLEVLRQLEGMHQLNLGPYTHSSKQTEVENLIEGLSQLGYAWDTMDREIGVIQDLLQSFGPAQTES